MKLLEYKAANKLFTNKNNTTYRLDSATEVRFVRKKRVRGRGIVCRDVVSARRRREDCGAWRTLGGCRDRHAPHPEIRKTQFPSRNFLEL